MYTFNTHNKLCEHLLSIGNSIDLIRISRALKYAWIVLRPADTEILGQRWNLNIKAARICRTEGRKIR